MEITITFKDLLLLFNSGEWDVETFMLGLPNIVYALGVAMFEEYLGTHYTNNDKIDYYSGDIFNLSDINVNDKDYSDKDYSDKDISSEEIFTPLCKLISSVRTNGIIEGIKYDSKEDITEIHYAYETLSESVDHNLFTEIEEDFI